MERRVMVSTIDTNACGGQLSNPTGPVTKVFTSDDQT